MAIKKASAISGALRGLVQAKEFNQRSKLLDFVKEKTNRTLDLKERSVAVKEGTLSQALNRFNREKEIALEDQQKDEQLLENLVTVRQAKDFSRLQAGINDPNINRTPEFLQDLNAFRKEMVEREGLELRQIEITPGKREDGDFLMLVREDGGNLTNENILVDVKRAKNEIIADVISRAKNARVISLVEEVLGKSTATDRMREVVDVVKTGRGHRLIRRDGTVEEVTDEFVRQKVYQDRDSLDKDTFIIEEVDEKGRITLREAPVQPAQSGKNSQQNPNRISDAIKNLLTPSKKR